ncbi:uncharacterized protein CIMG_08684 [Coccidioides immitis RS]|uniref:Monopolin complex subunit Csm1/Pcs1 C-terminal domain-containing protein n=3 Tax=Coccidioides immitis TaxID=5501 RepID=A0A0E1RVF7_COCIM|nr:uncharacterized protein CIMG_08684 [Coccidioides immitis RS]EAS29938.1 hypothetical protein CIMG_08684 [Coccidioides immitis RS]KMP06923.1 hypothetical protein CIRG_06604 [Coccidioides immitis RMSCC 2394]TPX22218.1 hypothetical protein DIZ76_014084 [Coccidioides immitis]
MPKRKATSNLSGIVGGGIDDDGLLSAADQHDVASPPAKRMRGRPKSTATQATKTKTTTRKARSTVVVGPKRRGANGATAAKQRKANEVQIANAEAAHTLEEDEEASDDAHQLSEDELDSPETTATVPPKQEIKAAGRRGRRKEPEKEVVKDGEFEYTPTGTRGNKPAPKSRRTGKRTALVARTPSAEPETEEQPIGEHGQEEDSFDIDEAAVAEAEESDSSLPLPSPLKRFLKGIPEPAPAATPSKGRRTGSNLDIGNESNEAMLKRKLTDVSKKLESMEARYRSLRQVGIVEASANVEKLRQQCESMTAASNALITSLKDELATQTELAQQSQTFRARLSERDDEVSELKSRVGSMSSDLSKAQNEIKALQAKLMAARNAAANEQPRVPGSTGKGGRAAMAANAESAQALQIAQLKEDLYSDLTGLIIRDVKARDGDYMYDCIQTGLNGTLHFKLVVADDSANKITTDLEAAEFQYMPLLDDNRDRDLLEILPEYLAVDITFSRQHASKFYSRVVDTLTKRRIDDS